MKIRFWLCLLTLALVTAVSAELIQVAPVANSVRVLHSSEAETVLQYTVGSISSVPVRIQGEEYQQISLPGEAISQEKAYPALPVFNRSLIIPSGAGMRLEISDLQFTDLPMRIAPSRGVISRDLDPAAVEWEFGDCYFQPGFYPSQLASLSEPYILRDFRGITVRTSPLAYDHLNRTLRVYTAFTIRVYAQGSDSRNQLNRQVSSFNQSFLPVYRNHFINFESSRYAPVDDSFGKLLVISTSNFMTDVNNYVNWKRQKGIPTELVLMSAIGTTATQLQSYIQARYTADPDIAYVQLFGDSNLIPTLLSGGGGSDPGFALVAGSDSYPDIFVGRFSAQTQSQLATQVLRTIVYERDLTDTATWLSRGVGIASAEGGSGIGDDGESDIVHMNGIRADLLSYGYNPVDQIYDPGATDSQVINAINAGRGWLSYTGHGSTTAWSTSGFDTTDALNLSNENKLPVIVDVACQNGNFTGTASCLAEAWMQSSHGTNGNPTGAIAIYASSINQSWNAPMSAQDEVVDLMVQELKTTAGGLFYNGACKMMDEYGTDGINMFRTWNIFGDASLEIRNKTPQTMTVSHPAQIQSGVSTLCVSTGVSGARASLTYADTIYATGITNSLGELTLNLSGQPLDALCYTLTVTAKDKVTYTAGVQQVLDSGPCLRASAIVYDDVNNDLPEYQESGVFNVIFTNSGSAPALNVLAILSSVSPGVTVTDGTELVQGVAVGASITVSSAFGITIADNVANGSLAQFNLVMTSGHNVWNQSFSLSLKAPVLHLGSQTILDPGGNNNGQLDPGETVTCIIPLGNTGAAVSPEGLLSLESGTPGLLLNPVELNFSPISPGGSAALSFEIYATPGLAPGSLGTISLTGIAGAYSSTRTYLIGIGSPIAVTIGSGTSTQTYPLDRFYNYSTHESVYLASEIGRAGIIQSLGFEKASGADVNSITNVSVYMKHTTATALSTGSYSNTGYTLVFSGSFPNNSSGWMEVELQNRFNYDGLSNLSILIVKGYQAWTNSYPLWKYSTCSTNRARQARSDDSQPTQLTATTSRPNLRFNLFSANNAPLPRLSAVNGNIMIQWTAVSGAQSYKVMAASSPDGVFTQIGRTGQTWFSDPGPASSQKYYKIIASSDPM